ncbi:DUF4339 domain-containing protein [Stieleria sp. TO1_6]|uniref:DUF4339 domain-containing protein n=1 Tax=Stieleria tagensis TaxID=2956795 RepID=UPI00209BA83B|nr:DUF4339 domain-containing protein [Stieleria tagensis]MCO8124597.1 DUF4339 domain-containing protein [Stieleria tagensis]
MGIRFSCHGCGKPLNIKPELAGRRGVCPECQIRFRIPTSDTQFSSPIESPSASAVQSISVRSEQSVAADKELPRAVPAQSPSAAVPAQSTGAAVTPVVDALRDSAAEAIESLIDDEGATWYVRPPSGGQYGPATGEVLKGWIREGRVAKNALLWRDGWPQWREAAETLPEMIDRLPGTEATGALMSAAGAGGQPAMPAFGQQPSSVDSQSAVVSLSNSEPAAAGLSGHSKIGATRRKRTSRRITLVAVLATLVIGLLATLLLVAGSGGLGSGAGGG